MNLGKSVDAWQLFRQRKSWGERRERRLWAPGDPEGTGAEGEDEYTEQRLREDPVLRKA